MSGMGPPPKPNSLRRNDPHEGHLEPEGDVPAKLKKLRNRATYCAATQEWFDVWANSPQSEHFMATDWLRLQMIAVMVENFFVGKSKGSHYSMAEIRQNESLLGATVLDRMRLRMGDKKADAAPGELPEDVLDFMAHMEKSS